MVHEVLTTGYCQTGMLNEAWTTGYSQTGMVHEAWTTGYSQTGMVHEAWTIGYSRTGWNTNPIPARGRVTDCGVIGHGFKSQARFLLLEPKPVLYHEWSGIVETNAL